MNCNPNENVCSVQKENNLGYYRLHTIWNKNGFFINITSKNGAWRGEMSPSDVEKMSSQLEMTPDTYMKQCKEALTSHDGLPGMTYAVEDNTFTWKKVVDEDSGIKVKMGSVMLQPASFVDTIQDLVTVALNCNRDLQKQFKNLSEENTKNLGNCDELLEKLNKFIETKDKMENDLYSKFILLLNSKKKKIRELESLLKSRKDADEAGKSEVSNSDAYYVETESDASEEGEPFVKKSKSSKSEEKSTKSSLMLGESSSFEGMECDVATSSSLKSFENLKGNDSTERIPSTKEEILDFFYGSG